MNLRDQLTSVQNQLADEKSKVVDRNAELIAQLEAREADLLQAIMVEDQKEQTAAQQVRIQEQEEKVQSIKLPYDFNELYGDTTANDSIIEVVQIFQRESNAEHNEEMQKLIDTHRAEIQASADRELQLKRQNDELQQKEIANQQEILRISQELQQTKLERDDAFAKRDAAVSDKEGTELLIAEKQAQIDTLRAEIAVGAKSAINVTNISPSDKLAALVEQSKSAKIKSSLELALERTELIRGKVEVVAPPKAPEEATFPTQTDDTATNGLDNIQASGIPTSDQEVAFPVPPRAEAPDVSGEIQVVDPTPTDGGQGQTVEERLSALEDDMVKVKERLFTPVGQVA